MPQEVFNTGRSLKNVPLDWLFAHAEPRGHRSAVVTCDSRLEAELHGLCVKGGYRRGEDGKWRVWISHMPLVDLIREHHSAKRQSDPKIEPQSQTVNEQAAPDSEKKDLFADDDWSMLYNLFRKRNVSFHIGAAIEALMVYSKLGDARALGYAIMHIGCESESREKK